MTQSKAVRAVLCLSGGFVSVLPITHEPIVDLCTISVPFSPSHLIFEGWANLFGGFVTVLSTTREPIIPRSLHMSSHPALLAKLG